jgi:hypothetical protein
VARTGRNADKVCRSFRRIDSLFCCVLTVAHVPFDRRFELRRDSVRNNFAFALVDGALVKAVQNGRQNAHNNNNNTTTTHLPLTTFALVLFFGCRQLAVARRNQLGARRHARGSSFYAICFS